ncbi:MAG: adenylate kinase [Clostridia bacterium]|nr:adenylate kinase [Clostridia bacterium]
MMKRIMVIGCSGAGKSTFSRALQKKTGLPLYHLDLIWHKPDKTTISREEFDAALAEIVEREEWFLDGNYGRTLAVRMQKCDTVIFLDIPLEICLQSIEARIGEERPDLPWQETELDPEFRAWVEDFPNRSLPKIQALLEQYREKHIVVLKSRREMDEYLEELQ